VNNAGIMERVNFLEESVSDERIAYEIAVNIRGPILLTRRLLPLLRSGRNPMIVMVTSGYAARHGRSDLLRDQGRSPRLHDGAAAGWLILRQRLRSVKQRCPRRRWLTRLCATSRMARIRYCPAKFAYCRCLCAWLRRLQRGLLQDREAMAVHVLFCTGHDALRVRIPPMTA
jgi:NAD(P)-dependent dehydrogenase (short-subunit alcohol dehydrogenase family)